MDWNAPTVWWLAAGALVAAELATGTFYLLMLALGAVAGALAAHTSWSGTAQWLAAALCGVGATVVWHVLRSRAPPSAPPSSNRDVNLDVGQTLQVPAWQADGTARVAYRGASWQVRLAPNQPSTTGEHTIVAVHGSELLLAPVARALPATTAA